MRRSLLLRMFTRRMSIRTNTEAIINWNDRRQKNYEHTFKPVCNARFDSCAINDDRGNQQRKEYKIFIYHYGNKLTAQDLVRF